MPRLGRGGRESAASQETASDVARRAPTDGLLSTVRLGLFIIGLLGGLGGIGRADAADPETVRRMAEAGNARTVGIYCERDDFQSFYGTGAVISADGHILTSTTVVPTGAKEIQVVFDGLKTRKAEIVEVNVPLETTLIKVEAENLPFFPLATALPAVGARAFTYGNAHNVFRLNGRATFSMGIVSGLYEIQDQGGESLYAGLALETSAAVNPGSDGGPIVNQAGQLCAIVSLNFSPLRWQGVGVPVTELVGRLEAFKNGKVKTSTEPLFPLPAEGDADSLAAPARQARNWLVGVQVERKFPPEVLPRLPWEKFVATIPDFAQKPLPEKARIQEEYFNAARLLEVNQLLRRPTQPSTGVVVSADGYVVTSLFNVGEDMVFKEKSTGQPKKVEFKTAVDELTKFSQSDSLREQNPIEKIFVVQADGARHEARLVARHLPLGLALLKFEAQNLPYADVTATAAEPVLGVRVGMLGFVANPASPLTLNTGIVSVQNRNRGLQFQTDALLNYGNSGGPVVTSDGKLLGFAGAPIEPRTILGRILSLDDLNNWPMAPNSGVGMVARADRLAPYLDQLKAGKSVETLPGPYVGIGPDTQTIFGDRVLIGSVADKSPAALAGLKAGDQLLAVDGVELNAWRDLTDQIDRHKAGDVIRLKVRRPSIVQHLIINGQQVGTDAQLQQLMKSLKNGDKIEGKFVKEDETEIAVTLGERKP